MDGVIKTDDDKGLKLSLNDVQVLFKSLRKADISREESDEVYFKVFKFLKEHEQSTHKV